MGSALLSVLYLVLPYEGKCSQFLSLLCFIVLSYTYYQKWIILCYQKIQPDLGETLSELFFQVFELRVNMNRFENNFIRGVFSIS